MYREEKKEKEKKSTFDHVKDLHRYHTYGMSVCLCLSNIQYIYSDQSSFFFESVPPNVYILDNCAPKACLLSASFSSPAFDSCC